MSKTYTRSRLQEKARTAGPPIVGAVVAITLWWLAVVIFDIREFFLPTPSRIVERFAEQPTFLLEETWVTLYETVTGYGIAVVAGVAVAILLAASPLIERATLPLLIAVNSIPKVALAPLLLVWIGFGPKPKIVMAVVICFFPLVVAAMAGLSSTPSDLGELSKSLAAKWWQSFLKVRLPWALPQIFVGLKVAISLAPIGAVVGEQNNPDRGLGSVIVQSGAVADTPLAFAAIVMLMFMSITLYYIVGAAERLVVPWAKQISA